MFVYTCIYLYMYIHICVNVWLQGPTSRETAKRKERARTIIYTKHTHTHFAVRCTYMCEYTSFSLLHMCCVYECEQESFERWVGDVYSHIYVQRSSKCVCMCVFCVYECGQESFERRVDDVYSHIYVQRSAKFVCMCVFGVYECGQESFERSVDDVYSHIYVQRSAKCVCMCVFGVYECGQESFERSVDDADATFLPSPRDARSNLQPLAEDEDDGPDVVSPLSARGLSGLTGDSDIYDEICFSEHRVQSVAPASVPRLSLNNFGNHLSNSDQLSKLPERAGGDDGFNAEAEDGRSVCMYVDVDVYVYIYI